MKTYIAVTELHARPDLTKPQIIVKAGQPFQAPDNYDVDDLVKSGVLRTPTAEEVKRFDISDKKPEPAKKAATEPAKKADTGKADAGKADDSGKTADAGKADDAADKLV